ncbi:hypothetical protein C1645_739680 [Glomus cerebriforme]|uniref:Uncharacterized protein n=1 Tax=Glomus cerebriforme TaxID=658196 RepID=A0A397SYR7_9GLOM|nr:hypothetical protein C1645_739680 [Glomus cerebriforme]
MNYLQNTYGPNGSNFTEVIDDRNNNLHPNQIQMEQQYLSNIPYENFSAMDGNNSQTWSMNESLPNITSNYSEQNPSFSLDNSNQQDISTSSSYEPQLQYDNNYIPPINDNQDIQDVHHAPSVPNPLPLNFPHFEFEIPGFKIFVVPTTTNLTNLDNVQNQFQNDSFSSNNNNNSIQFQQQNQNTFINDSFNFNNFNNFSI